MEELELVQAAKQGNLEAFNELILKYRDRVFHHACYVLANEDVAEDITQDTFILAFQKIHQYRGGSFQAWLFKIATNLCYDQMRSWKRTPAQTLEPINQDGESNESPLWIKDPAPLPEETVETHDLYHILEQAMNQLSPAYRAAVSLIDIQQLNYKDTASIMGVSIGTVKSRLARGRMQFHKILKELDINNNPEFNGYNQNTKKDVAWSA